MLYLPDLNIQGPTLLLDEVRCRRNIENMVRKAHASGVEFRPHFKTHQSNVIGSWFKESRVNKITVSSITMAKYFATEWNDITIAFPFNIRETDELNELAYKCRINILVESVETIGYLKNNLTQAVGFYIKIDTGYHRTGINPSASTEIDQILEETDKNSHLKFKGFLAHTGHTYNTSSKEEVLQLHSVSCQLLTALKEKYIKQYPDIQTSLGDTPSCSLANDYTGIDEIRPGNFVFYDLIQEAIGSCSEDQIAVAMACPIVAIHPERSELVIYGGGVHFSKEYMESRDEGFIYGKVVEWQGASWGRSIPGMKLIKLSQEHGIVSIPEEIRDRFKIGDILLILPVHSCMTVDLYPSYLNLSGRKIEKNTLK